MITNQIVIAGNQVSRIEYKGQPVITFKMIDELHQRPEGTAKNSFNRNKEWLVQDEDYFEVPFEEWKNFQKYTTCTSENSKQHNKIIFISQSGYLLLVKPFTDDLAWQVQRELVNCYFSVMKYNPLGFTDKKALTKRIYDLESKLAETMKRIDLIAKYGSENKVIPPINEIDISKIEIGIWYSVKDFYEQSQTGMSINMFGRLLTQTVKAKGLLIYRRNIRNVKKFILLDPR